MIVIFQNSLLIYLFDFNQIQADLYHKNFIENPVSK
jgi:hypothetical protein